MLAPLGPFSFQPGCAVEVRLFQRGDPNQEYARPRSDSLCTAPLVRHASQRAGISSAPVFPRYAYCWVKGRVTRFEANARARVDLEVQRDDDPSQFFSQAIAPLGSFRLLE